MVSGISICTETALSEMLPRKLPREIPLNVSIKTLCEHLCLKVISTLIIVPFHSSYLVESVQVFSFFFFAKDLVLLNIYICKLPQCAIAVF